MKLKIEYIILIVIIIAAGLYLANKKTDQTHYTLPELPAIDKKEITKLSISSASGSYALIKEEDKWFFEDNHLPANKQKVEDMLDIVTGLTLSALVSKKESYERYELSDAAKTTVTAWTNDTKQLTFDLGKPASSYRHTYIKLDTTPHVYLAEKNFQETFSSDTDRLIDKTVFQTQQDQFSAIEADFGDTQLSLRYKTETPEVDLTKAETPETDTAPKAKPEPLWVTADNAPADKAAVSDLMKALAGLKCERFITDEAKESFTSAELSISLIGDKTYTLSIYPATTEDANQYPAVSSIDDQPFILSSDSVDTLKKNLGQIQKKK